jgi:hypothetical protein
VTPRGAAALVAAVAVVLAMPVAAPEPRAGSAPHPREAGVPPESSRRRPAPPVMLVATTREGSDDFAPRCNREHLSVVGNGEGDLLAFSGGALKWVVHYARGADRDRPGSVHRRFRCPRECFRSHAAGEEVDTDMEACFSCVECLAREETCDEAGFPLVVDNRVLELTCSEGGRLVASVHSDGLVRLTDARLGGFQAMFRAPPGKVSALALSGDDRLLAISSDRIHLFLLAPRGASALEVGAVDARAASTQSLAFTRDGGLLVVGIAGARPRVMILQTSSFRAREIAAAGAVHAVSLSADGRLLLVGGDGELALWDLEANKRRLHLRTGYPIDAVKLGEGGDLLVFREARAAEEPEGGGSGAETREHFTHTLPLRAGPRGAPAGAGEAGK